MRGPWPLNLTRRQHQVYEFIVRQIQLRGYGPTVREIGQALGIRSPNGVVGHLRALERKGLIQRDRHISRGIHLPDHSRPSLPVAGVIAAGLPLEAVETRESVDFSDFFHDPEVFLLRVRGDSMMDAHIVDGDYVVVRRQAITRNGQIVVAMVDGEDATLKRFYRERDRIRLEPAHPQMEPIYVAPGSVQILGVVIGVIRRFPRR
jgi:repressor LexA